jgi:hypothetical protein
VDHAKRSDRGMLIAIVGRSAAAVPNAAVLRDRPERRGVPRARPSLAVDPTCPGAARGYGRCWNDLITTSLGWPLAGARPPKSHKLKRSRSPPGGGTSGPVYVQEVMISSGAGG